MKIVIAIILTLFFVSSFCQQTTTIIYDSHGNIKSGSFIKTVPPQVVTLKDTILNYTFVLDSSHNYVTAHDSIGNIVWKTDPYKDNRIEEYRTKRPIIVDFLFGPKDNVDSTERNKVLWVMYSNTQFGFLNLKTGKYEFVGQY